MDGRSRWTVGRDGRSVEMDGRLRGGRVKVEDFTREERRGIGNGSHRRHDWVGYKFTRSPPFVLGSCAG